MFPRLALALFLALLAMEPALAQSKAVKSGSPSADAGATPPPGSDASEVRFSGEALHGQAFERDIGHNMFFRMTPATSDEGGGWVIQILPPHEDPDDPIEFSEIATPPYHAYNDRYLAGAFGYSAKEAVEARVRKFYFVKSVADIHAANEVVNAALYPSSVADADRPRIAAKAADIELGSGELRIVRFRIVTPKDQPDIITWLKFDVVLNFSPGVTLQQVLAPKAPSKK